MRSPRFTSIAFLSLPPSPTPSTPSAPFLSDHFQEFIMVTSELSQDASNRHDVERFQQAVATGKRRVHSVVAEMKQMKRLSMGRPRSEGGSGGLRGGGLMVVTEGGASPPGGGGSCGGGLASPRRGAVRKGARRMSTAMANTMNQIAALQGKAHTNDDDMVDVDGSPIMSPLSLNGVDVVGGGGGGFVSIGLTLGAGGIEEENEEEGGDGGGTDTDSTGEGGEGVSTLPNGSEAYVDITSFGYQLESLKKGNVDKDRRIRELEALLQEATSGGAHGKAKPVPGKEGRFVLPTIGALGLPVVPEGAEGLEAGDVSAAEKQVSGHPRGESGLRARRKVEKAESSIWMNGSAMMCCGCVQLEVVCIVCDCWWWSTVLVARAVIFALSLASEFIKYAIDI